MISSNSINDLAKNSPLLASTEIQRELLRRRQAETDREALPQDLKQYTKAIWPILEPGQPFVDGVHIDAICEHLTALAVGDIRNLIITIPPRHTKSLLSAVSMPTWIWTWWPEARFLCTSYASILSIRDTLKSRRVIQSDWYQDRWGNVYELAGDQNAKTRYENDKTGYRIATSVDGTGTGEGGDFIIGDDLHNLKEIHSKVSCESVIEYWDQVIPTRLNNPKTGRKLLIMQRGATNDIVGHVLKQGGYEHLNLPAEYDGDKKKTVIGWSDPRTKKGELLCPERFGPKEIADLKVRLGPYGASAQLQQKPIPDEGGIFKKSWYKLWPANQRLPQFTFIIQSYDTAFTEKTSNDPCAMTAWGVFRFKGLANVMLIDAWGDYLEYPALRRRVKLDRKAKYGEDQMEKGVDLTLIEAKGNGLSLLQDLKEVGVAAWPYNPLREDKIVRAHAVTPLAAAGFVWLMQTADKSKPLEPVEWARPVLDQVVGFPGGDHDDFVDTKTQALLYLKNRGLIEARLLMEEGEDEPEAEERPRKAEPIYG